MKESFKRAMPTIQNAATIGAIASAGVITFYAMKDRDERPHHSVKFQGSEYTFGSNKVDRKSREAQNYICPPFGGKCKSFDTEAPKSAVRNRM